MFRGKVRNVHFVGIGGIGMSGIAEVLVNMGFRVTGSDMRVGASVRRLQSLGAEVAIGHAPDNVGDADVVVRSTAIGAENVEIATALTRNIPVIPRAEMLAELTNPNPTTMEWRDQMSTRMGTVETSVNQLTASVQSIDEQLARVLRAVERGNLHGNGPNGGAAETAEAEGMPEIAVRTISSAPRPERAPAPSTLHVDAVRITSVERVS